MALARRLIVAGLTAIPVGIVISNWTERVLTIPAGQTIALLTSGSPQIVRTDSEGIPKVYYSRLRRAEYNPIYVSLFGLAYYERWMQSAEFQYFLSEYPVELPSDLSSAAAKSAFIRCADWLVLHLRVRRAGPVDYGVWEYGFAWPVYNLTPPWVSGMAQGLGIQVLARAWRRTHQTKYLVAGRLARNAFYIGVKDGGVTRKDAPDAWWFDEYASPTGADSRVLNGMEHALIGLSDFRVLAGDTLSNQLLHKGLASLAAHIHKFDAGWWTFYDLRGQLANLKYEVINVNLTRKLYALTGSRDLGSAAAKWQTYRTKFIEREFFRQQPNYVDWVILIMNVVFSWLALFALLSLAALLGSQRHVTPAAERRS